VTFFKTFMSDRYDVCAAVDRAEMEFGGFDMIATNADIAQVPPVAGETPEELNEIAHVNAAGGCRDPCRCERIRSAQAGWQLPPRAAGMRLAAVSILLRAYYRSYSIRIRFNDFCYNRS
jgi:NAD(P)-dependent dehydrogenase (short-subunit alcohol dehydrogenase family)